MSAAGTLRDRMHKIHDMLPLSDRERKLAEWAVYGDGEVSIEEEVREDPGWWGVKAVKLLEVLNESS